MINWVVTGPIGAGKSSVTRHLKECGAVIVDADELGHEVLETPAIITAVAQEFGSECVPEIDGQPVVDRGQLGRVVFGNKTAMEKLNALTHPALVALAESRLKDLARKGQHKLAVLEAAVYFLWPPMDVVDLVISVVAEPDVRRQRLLNTRGLTAQQVNDRISSQKALEPFWTTAQVVLENNEDLNALQQKVDDLLVNLKL